MPVVELKKLLADLEAGTLAPAYLIHGPEELRARETMRRIETAHAAQEKRTVFAEELSWPELRDGFQSLGLFAKRKLWITVDWVTDNGAEDALAWVKSLGKDADASSLWILWEPKLDLRKKGVKDLIEALPTFHAEAIPEAERARWVQHLITRKDLGKWVEQDPALVALLCSLPDWSLSQVERELEKWALLEEASFAKAARQFLSEPRADSVIYGIFDRKPDAVLPALASLSQSPEEAFPLIGLLHWHARMLLSQHLTRERIPGYFQDKARRWSGHWNVKRLAALEAALVELDVGLKSSFRSSLGLWTDFALTATKI